MNNIETIAQLNFGDTDNGSKAKDVKEIFNGPRRRLVEVKLNDNATLPKHKAAEPITVLCLAGTGTFRAGPDLQDEQKLTAGTLVTLEAEIEHEVVAEPMLHVLVTKYKST
jgi:quercetin dioxygenase-like cupin family protein